MDSISDCAISVHDQDHDVLGTSAVVMDFLGERAVNEIIKDIVLL